MRAGREQATGSGRGLVPQREQTVTADDGVRLWTARAGDGIPVLCCHGGPGLWDMFEPVRDLLVDCASLYRWDQRGCGRSPRVGPYTIARTMADLDAVRHAYGLQRTVLLGHSWGAQLALLYALAHPHRITGLIYVSGTGIDADQPWHDAYRQAQQQRLGEHLARWQELKLRDRTPDEDRERCVLQWSADFAPSPDALAHADRLATPWLGVNIECNTALNAETAQRWASGDLAAACQALGVPTLIVDGTEDIRPRSAVDSLEQALPDVRRVVLTDAGHLPWIEDPAGFQTAVIEFLSSIDGRDGAA